MTFEQRNTFSIVIISRFIENNTSVSNVMVYALQENCSSKPPLHTREGKTSCEITAKNVIVVTFTKYVISISFF